MENRKIDQKIDLTTSVTVEKGATLEHGEIEVIVSNNTEDRHGEKIEVNGIDLNAVKRNPVVLWAHDYFNLPIGKITKLWKKDGNLMARIKFATDIYEFAETVYKLVLDGYIGAVSIGGIVRQWSDDFTSILKLEMLEVSMVPIGANPDALVTAKNIGMDPDAFKKQYVDFIQKSFIDKMKKIPENELMHHLDALKSLTSAIESAYEDSVDSEDSDQKTAVRKLVVMKQNAKVLDKQIELIISTINKQIDTLNK